MAAKLHGVIHETLELYVRYVEMKANPKSGLSLNLVWKKKRMTERCLLISAPALKECVVEAQLEITRGVVWCDIVKNELTRETLLEEMVMQGHMEGTVILKNAFRRG